MPYNRYSDIPHYDDDDEYYDTGYGSDDGYDAIKDANAEAGRPHNSPLGIRDARRNGWIRKVRRGQESD